MLIIDAYTSDFGNPVGIHMRHGDNVQAINRRLTSAFVELMTEELDCTADGRFSLAADSPHDEQLLRQTFPEMIVSYPKASYDSNEPKTIQDALIGLDCLSRFAAEENVGS